MSKPIDLQLPPLTKGLVLALATAAVCATLMWYEQWRLSTLVVAVVTGVWQISRAARR